MVPLLVTEVRVKGENEHVVVPHDELIRLLKANQLEGVFKYGAYDRAEPDAEVKTVFSLSGPFLKKGRPTASAVISSANEDRDGDIVVSSGLVLTENYQKNPVVLPMHSHDFPVGMAEKIKQTKNSIWAKWQWLVDLEETGAATYQKLWDAHVLNCTSIGFLPMEWEPRSAKEALGGGYLFTQWELLEFSPVVIPSNREAMRTDGVKGLLEAVGEVVMSGPSPLLKGFWEASMMKDRPKQVAVPKIGEVKIDFSDVEEQLLDAIGEAIKGAIPYKRHPLADENAAWDAGKEVREADVKQLKEMCAWYDSSKPDIKSSYKLPHHYVRNFITVWNGVRAAMGALLGARGGVNIPDGDRKGVYNHLAKHYKEFDKEPPEFKDYTGAELVELFPDLYGDLTDTSRVKAAYAAGTLSAQEALAIAEKIDEGRELLLRSAIDGEEAARLENESLKRELEELASRVITTWR